MDAESKIMDDANLKRKQRRFVTLSAKIAKKKIPSTNGGFSSLLTLDQRQYDFTIKCRTGEKLSLEAK